MNKWFLLHKKSQKNCEHKKWTPMWPPEKKSASKKYERYNLYLHEICIDCGKKRKRFCGVMSEGSNN